MTRVNKSEPSTLYVRRDVLNADEIIAWAKGQGFKTTLTAGDMHVTVMFTRSLVDWMKVPDSWAGDEDGNIEVKPGGARVVEPLGPKGAVVLMFNCSELSYRHVQMREIGATWDWEGYQPHITITYDPAGLDLDTVAPYQGAIELGPEIFEEVMDGFADTITEKYARVCKIDDELGLVFGWAIVCKVNGEDYYDLNIDRDTGEKVPEHIPEGTMLKAAADFMMTARPGNEMHAGPDTGTHVFAFPLTTEIAKSLGIVTEKTGLLIAYKPEPAVLAKFKDGTYRGFSIEGSYTNSRETVHA